MFPGTRTETGAINAVKTLAEANDWIYRPQDGRGDLGVDAELELAEHRGRRGTLQATGRLLKAQIRGRRKLKWSEGRTVFRVKARTHNLWFRLGLPLVFFLQDADTGRVHWTTPYGAIRIEGDDHVPYEFLADRSLDQGFACIRGVLDLWAACGGPAALTEVIPRFADYQELTDDMSGSSWLPISPEQEGRLRNFYKHVEGLRLSLGEVTPSLRPFSDWSVIDKIAYPDGSEGLHYGVLFCAVATAAPAYLRALEQLRRRSELSPEAVGNAYWELEGWLHAMQFDHESAKFYSSLAESQLAAVLEG